MADLPQARARVLGAERSAKRPGRIGFAAWAGIGIFLLFVFVAVAGSWLAPYSEVELVGRSFAPPTADHILGTDFLGRDVLSRVLHGAKRTMGLAFLAVSLAFIIGVGLGIGAAVSGRWLDAAISRSNDLFMSFPSIMLALVVIASLGTSIPVLIVTVGVIESTRVLRVARAVAMDIVVKEYVLAARARGEGRWYVMRHEVLPNAAMPLAAEFGLRYTFSILFMSSLSFLGLGVQPPAADWGAMIRENMPGLLIGSSAAVFPAIAIALFTIAVNLLVDTQFDRRRSDISQALIR